MTRETSEPLLPPAHRRFKPYPSYKDSGVEWLGEIPAHWEVTPLKHVANFINGFAFKPDEWGLEGIPIIRIENLNGGENFNCTTRTLPAKYCAAKGDLLFGWSGNRGTSFGPFLWSRDGTHYVNQHIFRVVDFASDKTWMYWALRGVTFYVEKQAHGIIGMVHVTRGEVGTIPIPVLPHQEQEQIAEFLEREHARIDGLVAKKERLIELLQEKRAALITRAVTKGLDPTIPMKDSGVEWLGQIPMHWQVKRTKFAARLRSGHTPSRQHPEYWQDCTIPWFGLADVWQIRDGQTETVTETSEKISELGLANSAARLLPRGTVMLSRTASVGFSSIMGVDMATTQDFVNWVCGASLRPEYLLYVFRSMQHEFQGLTMGSTHQTIYMPDVGRFSTPMPPIDEQDRIVQVVRAGTREIDALVAKVREAIGRLQELRIALISAAVTGKIDVRAA